MYSVGQSLCRRLLLALCPLLLAFLSLHFSNALSHRAVGKEHEFLNQLRGIGRVLEVAAQRLSLLVDVELHLFRVEVDGSLCEPLLPELLCQQVESRYVELSPLVGGALAAVLLCLFYGGYHLFHSALVSRSGI